MIVEKNNLVNQTVCLKLTTMEEVVGKLLMGDDSSYVIENPKKVVSTNNHDGIDIGSYILANPELSSVTIQTFNVVSISKVDQHIEDLYRKSVI